MFMLSEEVKLTLVQAALVTGLTDPDSSRVDMAGYDGVMFIGILGAITATGTVTMVAKQADTDIVGAALSGATVAADSADDDKLFVIDIAKPTKRFLGTTLTRDVANSAYGGTIAVQYTARSKPTAQDAAQMAASLVRLVSPDES